MRTLSKDITNIGWDIALMKTSGPHPPMVSHLDEMEDAAADMGVMPGEVSIEAQVSVTFEME